MYVSGNLKYTRRSDHSGGKILTHWWAIIGGGVDGA